MFPTRKRLRRLTAQKPIDPARERRRELRHRMEAMRFWAPESPDEAKHIVGRMFDDSRIETILIRYLDQEIDHQELGYDLLSLAESITQADEENAEELRKGRCE